MSGHRRIGSPKLRWSNVIRNDMKEKTVKVELRRSTRPENVEIENSMR